MKNLKLSLIDFRDHMLEVVLYL